MTTALQLGLVVVIWLVALVPAALAALTFLGVTVIRRALGLTGDRPPYEDVH